MEPYLPLNASDEMRTTDNGKAILRRAFKHLERELPERVAWSIRNPRHPHAHWMRIPAGVLLVLGGVFFFSASGSFRSAFCSSRTTCQFSGACWSLHDLGHLEMGGCSTRFRKLRGGS